MKDRIKLEVLDRREFVFGAGAAAVIAANLPLMGEAWAQKASLWEAAMKKIVGDAKPVEGKVAVKLPEIAENGNTVPYSVTVESPMSDADYVKAIHVISTGNPNALVASYTLSPMSGKAKVSSRMRLAKTQDIIVVAEMSNGKFMTGKKTVKVTIGGCGG